MQVSVEELDGLERRITVQVPAENIDPKIQDRLKSLIPKVKLSGFRPGKVPLKVIKRMYGPQVRQEVLEEVLENSYRDALSQSNLRPVGSPKIEPQALKEGEDLQYTATFEVLPEFEVVGTDGIEVERQVAEVTETDVENMIETVRKQRTEWLNVDRPCQKEDRVTIDFEGQIDGQDFPNNKREDVPLILGSGTMPEAFENSLIGLEKGAEKEFDTTFVESYQVADLAGKTVHFTVEVKAVAEPKLPEVDAAFAESLGADSIEGLHDLVRTNMRQELEKRIEANIKDQLLQSLHKANDIKAPQALTEAEIEQMAHRAGLTDHENHNEEITELKNKFFAEPARERVALGLILSRLADTHNIEPDEARVRDKVKVIAASYDEPDNVARWYEGNPQAMNSVRSLVVEEQVIGWLLERANVTEKKVTFDEVMKSGKAATETSEEETSHDENMKSGKAATETSEEETSND
jgi:trigger factor